MESRKILTLHIQKTSPTETRISIIDNGAGIHPDAFGAIFSCPPATVEGAKGFGLHDAANGAVAMGARLTCQSEGLDKGAAFHLDLPLS